MAKHYTLILCFIGFKMMLFGQLGLSGTVIDSTGEPIAFASVAAGGNVVLSDLDGKFTLESARLSDSVFVRAMGYAPLRTLLLHSAGDTLFLKTDGVQLADVVINPGVNPALRMIKGAIKNRKLNRPEALEAFSYQGYNKLKLSFDSPLRIMQKDSTRKSLGFKDIFIVETLTEYQFKQPDRRKETVIASKISAYPGQAIPLSASDLQSISLYDEQVSVLGSRFTSPISSHGLSIYIYLLEDTIIRDQDSLFILRFLPRQGAYNALEGRISIQSGSWAVTYVDARLAIREPDLLLKTGTIRQLYQELDNGHWFPQQLDSDLDLKPMDKNSTRDWFASGRSYITDVKLGLGDEKVKWNSETIVLDPKAGEQDDLLREERTVALTVEEEKAYHFLDSLGKDAGLPGLMNQANHLALGRLKIKFVDLELDRLLGGNQVEATRLGLGLRTNEEISERFSVGGFGGYGFRDKQWKYGGDIQIKPLKTEKLVFGAFGARELYENGYARVSQMPVGGMWGNPYRHVTAGSYFQSVMNYVDQYMAWMYVELPTNLGLRFEAMQEKTTPAYDYSWNGDSVFQFREVNVFLRWAPGEEYTRQGWLRFAHKNDLPVVSGRVSRGIQDATGEYAWWRGDVSVQHRFKMGGRSGLGVRLNAGKIFEPVPLARAYVFPGIWARKNYFDVSWLFNTMRFNEFSANEYAEGMIRYQPYTPWLGVNQFRPKLTFVVNAAWGKWGSDGGIGHTGIAVTAPEKGFFEAGVFIQNIIPAPKKDNIQFSFFRMLGVGVYRRIGAYAFPDEKANWALRVTLAPF